MHNQHDATSVHVYCMICIEWLFFAVVLWPPCADQIIVTDNIHTLSNE